MNKQKPNSPQQRGEFDEVKDGVFRTYKELPHNPALKEKAKALRKAGNLSEVLFWNQVKKKKIMGLDFHRQKIIGNYIVDFYCPRLNLVIEIDGESHNCKVEYDEKRESYLRSLGLKIIHYDDIDIKKNLSGVMENLQGICKRNTPSDKSPTFPQEGMEVTGYFDGNFGELE